MAEVQRSHRLSYTPNLWVYLDLLPVLSCTWLPPLAAVLCGLLTIKHAWSRDHTTSSLTAVLPPPGQRCGTVSLNSFGNRTSSSDKYSNDRWKRLCLVSWAAAPRVWTLKALTKNLLTYLLTYLFNCLDLLPEHRLYRVAVYSEVAAFLHVCGLFAVEVNAYINSCAAGIDWGFLWGFL